MGAANDRHIEAAGGVLWRRIGSAPPTASSTEVAIVHRPKYDDWTLPKGKLNRVEHPVVAAVREVEEETGYRGRPGRSLGEIHYLKDGVPKRVSYWAIEHLGGDFVANEEVDELHWMSTDDAAERLAPDRDRPIIEAFAADVRATTPFVIVRHGSAGERSSFTGDDAARPLDELGQRQALALVPVFEAFGIERIVSADVARCTETVAPFGAEHGFTTQIEKIFSEDGYLAAPELSAERLISMFSWPPTVISSQGKVIPALVKRVCAELNARAVWDGTVAKGGFVVLNIADDEKSPVASVDRYRPVA
jgi:8-oxo-(d)GTP phosphatase